MSIMPSIRIVGIPPGEAPEEIRRAWIGLILPLMHGGYGLRNSWASFGVLTGPKSCLGLLVMPLLRRNRTDGYVVPVLDAVAILEGQHPNAAKWWRENVPHMMKAGRAFVFDGSVCELVYEDEEAT